jgi:uncharacterized protein YbjT (DUF2867 family)
VIVAGETILVLGGSGFVGRYVVNRFVRAGHRVVVPTRRRENARHLILLPTVDVVSADIQDPAALRQWVTGVSAVVNLVGILNESRRQTFARVHVELVQNLIAACRTAGVRRLLQMSALNADVDGPSRYLRSKGQAEAAIVASGLEWTIFRPSVIFGREDRFLNLFATLERFLPVMAIAAAETRFQPVFVGDVAQCVAQAFADDATIGREYPLCGPDIYSLRELVAFVGKLTDNERPILALGPWLGHLQARLLEMVPGTPMSRDNLASMQRDSVCGCAFPAAFGIAPAALATVAPTYLGPEAARSRYDGYRSHVGR